MVAGEFDLIVVEMFQKCATKNQQHWNVFKKIKMELKLLELLEFS